MNAKNILLGTSGWSYKEWESTFYEKNEKRKLRAYSQVFKTAEIDSTFYINPTKGTVMGWLKYSPPNFTFTAKLPKQITHTKKLGLKGNIKTDLTEFLELMRPLQQGDKLACLLIQLPPSYTYNPENLETFFDQLDPTFNYAAEFRNLSWLRDETWQLLQKYGVAYTNVDEPLLPPEVHVTTSKLAYFRWHGRGTKIWFDYKYTEDQLNQWIPKIEETAPQVKRILGYFNNHYHGYAPENCHYLKEKLGLLTEKEKTAQKTKPKQSTLFEYTE
jgi:uncharacterized protein YecE (DUF72 family)